MSTIHISITAEKLFTLGGFLPVTNSLLTPWIVMALLVVLSVLTTSRLKLIPGNLQSVMEIVIDGIHSLFESVLHDKVKPLYPLLATIFVFIIGLNWIGLLPGIGNIDFHHKEE